MSRLRSVFPPYRLIRKPRMWRLGVLALFSASVMITWHQMSSFEMFLSFLALCIILLGPNNLWLLYSTFPRDIKALQRYLSLRWKITCLKKRNVGVPVVFQENVRKHPNKIAFLFEDEKWTFQQVEDYSNRIANYFKERGIKHGDCVGLYMENSVYYIAIWLGLTKLGAVPALINTNLKFTSLRHCVDIVNAIIIITGVEGQTAFEDIRYSFGEMPIYVIGGAREPKVTLIGAINLDVEMRNSSTLSPPELEKVNFTDKMLYIYTSGTTGLPKAAVITHSRCFMAAIAASCMIGLKASSDIIYSPLPLYHLAAGIMGTNQSLIMGTTVVLKRKFSVSAYWTDCIKYKVTVAQYIGEICRYLLNTPPQPEDTEHKVRLMFGNGLRPQIWKQFQRRFDIKQISEFYGATEGNCNIINMDGKPGAIGFVSVLLPSFYPCCLIKLDELTGKPLRDEKGLCIRCKPGEAGEFVGRIVRHDPVRDFHGYADKKATQSKVVEDVWKRGDSAFLSGDILVMDDEGYLYFKDRRGDTFRWKGENVSTTEVEGIISKLVVHLTDVVVYGVEVSGSEGRAGMAAILDPEKKVDLENLAKGVQKALPSYAWPLFLRLVTKMDMTGTYKLKKINLQKDGFNPEVVSDDLYFLDTKQFVYIPLTNDIYEKIVNGEVRL